MTDDFKIDPWGASNLLEEDYSRLIEEFGIEEISNSIRLKMEKNRFSAFFPFSYVIIFSRVFRHNFFFRSITDTEQNSQLNLQ